jgi:hypothetical protein
METPQDAQRLFQLPKKLDLNSTFRDIALLAAEVDPVSSFISDVEKTSSGRVHEATV